MVRSRPLVCSRGARGAPGPGSGACLLDVRVLEQGRVWVEPDGTIRHVRDLSPADAEALQAHLRANEDLLYAVVLRREVTARLLALAVPTSDDPTPVSGASPARSDPNWAVQAGGGEEAEGPVDAPGVGVPSLAGGWADLSKRGRMRVWADLGRGPRVWLEATPLMRSLQRQLAGSAAPAGRRS